MSASLIPQVSPAQVAKMIRSAILGPREYYTSPFCILGDPGVGKSSIPRQVCAELNVPFWDGMRPGQHETVELTGMPKIGEDEWHYVPSHELFPPPDFDGVIFIDEFTQLLGQEQKVYAAILDRAGVAGKRISPKAMIILAGNLTTSRAGANRMLSIIQDRTMQFHMVFSHDNWQTWGLNRNPPIHLFVRSYADFKQGSFCPPFDPALDINATPRSWERVSDQEYLHAKELENGHDFEPEFQTIVASLVGPGQASEYMAHRKHHQLLHGASDKILNTGKFALPDALSAVHAVIGAVSEKVRTMNGQLKDSHLENIIKFGNSMSDSMSVFLAISVMAASKTAERILKVPGGEAWVRKHKDALARRK